MDLNSWTPDDKARRVATLAAAYLATTATFVFWLGLHWPWYGAVGAGVALYFVLQLTLTPLLKSIFRA